MLEALVGDRALAPPGPSGVIELGPKAVEISAALLVDPGRAAKARRRFAFACLDWTERRAHLGGALGAELFSRFLQSGWLARQPETRALLATGKGRAGLRRALGVSERPVDAGPATDARGSYG